MVNLNITVDKKSQYKCKNILRLSKPGPANPKINQKNSKRFFWHAFVKIIKTKNEPGKCANTKNAKKIHI